MQTPFDLGNSFTRTAKSHRKSRSRPSRWNRLALEQLETRLTPTTYTVNLTTDANVAFGITAGQLDMGGEQTGPDAGDLRYCLSQANMTSGPNTIDFAVFPNSTIVLKQVLMIYNDVIIDGSTATNLTISGGGAVRPFFVLGGNVAIEDVTISDGLAQGGTGGNGNNGSGGGGAGMGGGLLIDGGTVSLYSVTFTGDQANGGAGGKVNSTNAVGGGGGAGGIGASAFSDGGGGGFLGDGGGQSTGSSGIPGLGGGGGFTGMGGDGSFTSGTAGGNGASIGGGGGGGDNAAGGMGSTDGGGNGIENGAGNGAGGGGGSSGFTDSSSGQNADSSDGGNGGFGGGGGGGDAEGGAGGDYGGGGGSLTAGGPGGFGGGGGGGRNSGGGPGGFGGGGGGSAGLVSGSGGQFGGQGGDDSSGGGGAGLGGAIFIRAGNLYLQNITFNDDSASGGAAGGAGADGGEGKGGAVFINTGATVIAVQALPSFSGDSATDAGTMNSNPQDNNDVYGTLGLDVATHFVVSGPPAVQSFSQWDFTITAEDASNQVVPGYSGYLNLTSTQDPNLVYSSGNPVNLTAVINSFDVAPKKTGVYTLTATDPANGNTGTSNDFTVTPGPATRFEVDAPPNATQGDSFTFTVTAQDLFNNTATAYSGTVSFSSTDGLAVLPTPSTLTNGVGTFSATLNTVGDQTITATDIPNDLSGTTGDIEVISFPTITGISPSSGPNTGGTFITITGSEFASGATVTIGGTVATNVVVVSSTEITATTPAGTTGPANVVETNPDSGTVTDTDAFTYISVPTIAGVSPSSGPNTGGTFITITGSEFASGATVTIGGTAATSVIVVSSTEITATTPAGVTGAADVVETNPDSGTVTDTDAFTYISVPTIAGVSPSSGPNTGGTSITITGTEFGIGATVTIGGTAATNVIVVSSTEITATTPAGATGAANVVETNPDAGGVTDTDGFTYISVPTITGVSPSSGPSAGGTSITITGTEFSSGATVTVGGTAATNVVVVSSTETTATTPAGATGAADVVETNPDSGTVTDTSGFTYTLAPTITSANSTTFTVGTSGSFMVTSTGFPTVSLTETGALPADVTFVDNGNGTATLSGIPQNLGAGPYTFSFTVTAHNSAGPDAPQPFTLTVDQAPAISSANNASDIVYSAGSFQVTATGFPTPALTLTGTLPNGVVFDPATGILSGTPNNPKSFGNFPLTITASNGIGADATQSFVLQVSGIPSYAVTPHERYIAQVYLDLLGRVVDESGMANWSGQLDVGVAASEVVLEIEQCSLNEYQTVVVEQLYQRYLRRPADATGLQTWVNFLDAGGTDEEVAANLIGSPEYFQNEGGGANSTFLKALYQDVLNRPIDANAQTFFSNQLSQGISREAVALSVLTSTESYEDVVDAYYMAYLRRAADLSGLDYYIGQFENGATDQEVIASILGSNEFIQNDVGH